MRVLTLTLIFLILLIPDVLFIAYYLVAPVLVVSSLHSYMSVWLPNYAASNLVAIFFLASFVYVVILASALFYIIASPVVRRVMLG